MWPFSRANKKIACNECSLAHNCKLLIGSVHEDIM